MSDFKECHENEQTQEQKMPDNFKTVITDFANDLTLTFPEFCHLWNKWTETTTETNDFEILFNYCLTVFPERFFDILYQNEEIFTNEEINTHFLPDVDFKILYNCENVSENTKKTMWKYLQLILFTVLGSVKNKSNFGEAMNLFDGVDENELQTKLQETMEGMTDFFGLNATDDEETNNNNDDNENNGEEKQNFNFDENDAKTNIPNPEELHEHLKGLFDGKIGKFAKELAEEITNDISGMFGGEEETKNIRSTQDVIKKIIKNPKKMMDLVKTVSNKLNNKMKSGEITQEDLMKEAGEIFGKMKDMGGQTQFNEMFKNLASQMAGGGKNTKFDVNAMANAMKMNATKEKMKERLNQRKNARETTATATATPTSYTVEQKNKNTFVFKINNEDDVVPQHSTIREKEEIDKIMNELNLNDNDCVSSPQKQRNKTKHGKNKK